MKIFLTSICLIFLTCLYFTTVETFDPETGTGTIGPGGDVVCCQMNRVKDFNAHGSAYSNSVSACMLAGRDLTDEEMDEADKLPGNGYRDGKDGAIEAPIHEPKEEEAYCAQHVFDDENGTIVIIEDDGEVVIIDLDEVV